MRKALMLCLCALVVVFSAGHAMAQPGNYAADVGGDGTFESEATIAPGEQITFDVYLENAPGEATSGGAWVNFKNFADKISYVSAGRALTDGSEEGVTGPWDPSAGGISNEPQGVPGQLQIVVGQPAGVLPDAQGDIIVARVTLQCEAVGDAEIVLRPIPNFGTWGPAVEGYDDALIFAATPKPTLVVHQVEGTACVDAGDCDDGDLCTQDLCIDDICQNPPVDCSDGDLCTDDVCDPGDGSCSNPAVDCDDGDLCTDDTCDAGTGCINDPVDCSDGDLCTDDVCDPGDGSCSNPAVDCDDGDLCTDDTCDAGTGCINDPVDCSDGDLCTDDVCDPGDGSCSNPAVDCGDGDLCTDDVCDPGDGSCSNPAVDCGDGDLCTDDVCDPGDGSCSNPAVDCSDGNECTQDVCDPGDGSCSNPQEADGTTCDDGVFCNGDDTCSSGDCTAHSGDPCSTGETCSEGGGGRCTSPDCTSNAQCDDGFFCNGAEVCQNFTCQDGTPPCEPPLLCDEDGGVCAECLENADCDDGDFCNGVETCDPEAGCRPGSDPCPNDGEYCTGEEGCDEEADQCVNSGNPCAEDEICIEADDTCEPAEGIEATFSPSDLLPDATGCGRRWGYGAGLVTIQGTGTSFNLLTGVQYDSLQVFKGIKVVDDPQTIRQLVLLLPSFDPFLPVLLPAYPNEVTVTVSGFEATFEIPACPPLLVPPQ